MKQSSFLVRIVLCVTGIVAIALAPTVMAGEQDFTVVNATGVEIYQLFVSPHSTDSWEEDILGEDTLPDGEEVLITFSPSENAEMWDLQIVDGDENSITWENLNLLEISKVTLYYEDGRAWVETE